MAEWHFWARMLPGLLVSFWIGVTAGCGGSLLFAGRRVRQLETVNLLLRAKLKAREKPYRMGSGMAGPVLVVPPGAASHLRGDSLGRAASGH